MLATLLPILVPLLTKAFGAIIPDPEARDRAVADLIAKLSQSDLAQLEVDKAEAASANLFVAGWRPFIGWVCGASLAYAAIVHYALAWILDVISIFTGQSLPPLPKPDLGITLEILAGMLGLGGLRTYEKLNNVASITHK